MGKQIRLIIQLELYNDLIFNKTSIHVLHQPKKLLTPLASPKVSFATKRERDRERGKIKHSQYVVLEISMCVYLVDL